MTGPLLQTRSVLPPSDTTWHARGACNDADDTLFYHPENERGMARLRRTEQAKAICRTCPVMEACATDALARREPFGTWGGVSEDERTVILTGKTPKTPMPAPTAIAVVPLVRTIAYIPRAKTGHRIDAADVTTHVVKLIEAGYSATEIADAAGIFHQGVRDLARGAPTTTERSAALLLAVQPETKAVAA